MVLVNNPFKLFRHSFDCSLALPIAMRVCGTNIETSFLAKFLAHLI